MSTSFAIVAFAVGAAVSLATGWVLVSRLERVGERLGLSEAMLGLLAALAADAPEITAAITAMERHDRVVGAGVVIGSNVFNLAALLGLGALVAGSIGLHRRVVVFTGAVALWVALVAVLAVGGAVDPTVGFALVLVIVAPFVVVVSGLRTRLPRVVPQRWTAWLDSAVAEEELELSVAIRPARGRPRDAVVAAVALVVVVIASVSMERGATTIGHRHHVAAAVTGGLVLAAVTSLPNAIAAVFLARRGRGAAAMSTALNSNTINVLVGLLVPALAVGLARPSGPTMLTTGWYLGLTLLTLGLAYVGRGLARPAGSLIVLAYAAFVVALVLVS